MITEQFRKNNKQQRRRINILIIIGIVLIIFVPNLMNLIMNDSKPNFIVPINKNIKQNNSVKDTISKSSQGIDLFITDNRKFYYSYCKEKEIKFIIIARNNLEKFITNNSNEIYFIKAYKNAKYKDIVYIIDILTKSKVKNYAVIDISANEISNLDKIKQIK
jgi:biopolymer transport protein ExbD